MFKELGEDDRFGDELHDALTEHVVGQSLRESQAAATPGADESVPRVSQEVEDTRHMLARAISTLPERQKIALTLVYVEGMTVDEVAQLMGVTPSTARRWYRSALQELSTRLRSDRRGSAA